MELHVGTSAFQILMQAHFVSEFTTRTPKLQDCTVLIFIKVDFYVNTALNSSRVD